MLAVEVPYWELARRLSRADLAYLTDTDTYLSALAAAGGTGQLNWQLATGASGGTSPAVVGEDYAPLLTLDAALPASEVDAIGVPVTAISQPERLAVGDYAYLVDASGAVAEAVTVLAFDAANATIDLARGVLDTTPQAHASGTRLIGVGEWLASEGAERAPGESVFVGAIPRTSTDQGDPVLAANGQPMVLAGRRALPYPPGRIRLNGQTEPAVVAGDLTVAWAHRDRTQQPPTSCSKTRATSGRTGRDLHAAYPQSQRRAGAHRNGTARHHLYLDGSSGRAGCRCAGRPHHSRNQCRARWFEQLAAAGAGHGSRGLRPALGTVLGRCVMEAPMEAHRCSSAHPERACRMAGPAPPASKDAPIQFARFAGHSGPHRRGTRGRLCTGTLPLVSFVDPDDLYNQRLHTTGRRAGCLPAGRDGLHRRSADRRKRPGHCRAASGLQPLAAREQRQPRSRPDRDAPIRRRSRAQGNHRPQQLC